MKSKFAITFILLLVYSLGMAFAQEMPALNLDESIKEALKNNALITAGRFRVEQSKANITIETAQPNPEITLAQVHGDASESANNITQKLQIFGQKALSRIKAKDEYQLAVLQFQEAVNELTFDVKTAYFKVNQAEESLKIAQTNFNDLESIFAIAEKSFELGNVPKSQMLKTKLELTRSQLDLSVQERELFLARADLNKLLGREPSSALILTPVPLPNPLSVNSDELLKAALTYRPQFLAAQIMIKVQESQLKIASANFLPEANLSVYQSDLDDPQEKGASVSLTFPIFDLGLFRGQILEAKALLSEKQAEFKGVKNQTILEVEAAFYKLKESETRHKAFQESILSEANDLFSMAQKGYLKGASTLLEVLEAQRTLRAVKNEYLEACADYQISYAQLEKAVGKNLNPEVKP